MKKSKIRVLIALVLLLFYLFFTLISFSFTPPKKNYDDADIEKLRGNLQPKIKSKLTELYQILVMPTSTPKQIKYQPKLTFKFVDALIKDYNQLRNRFIDLNERESVGVENSKQLMPSKQQINYYTSTSKISQRNIETENQRASKENIEESVESDPEIKKIIGSLVIEEQLTFLWPEIQNIGDQIFPGEELGDFQTCQQEFIDQEQPYTVPISELNLEQRHQELAEYLEHSFSGERKKEEISGEQEQHFIASYITKELISENNSIVVETIQTEEIYQKQEKVDLDIREVEFIADPIPTQDQPEEQENISNQNYLGNNENEGIQYLDILEQQAREQIIEQLEKYQDDQQGEEQNNFEIPTQSDNNIKQYEQSVTVEAVEIYKPIKIVDFDDQNTQKTGWGQILDLDDRMIAHTENNINQHQSEENTIYDQTNEDDFQLDERIQQDYVDKQPQDDNNKTELYTFQDYQTFFREYLVYGRELISQIKGILGVPYNQQIQDSQQNPSYAKNDSVSFQFQEVLQVSSSNINPITEENIYQNNQTIIAILVKSEYEYNKIYEMQYDEMDKLQDQLAEEIECHENIDVKSTDYDIKEISAIEQIPQLLIEVEPKVNDNTMGFDQNSSEEVQETNFNQYGSLYSSHGLEQTSNLIHEDLGENQNIEVLSFEENKTMTIENEEQIFNGNDEKQLDYLTQMTKQIDQLSQITQNNQKLESNDTQDFYNFNVTTKQSDELLNLVIQTHKIEGQEIDKNGQQVEPALVYLIRVLLFLLIAWKLVELSQLQESNQSQGGLEEEQGNDLTEIKLPQQSGQELLVMRMINEQIEMMNLMFCQLIDQQRKYIQDVSASQIILEGEIGRFYEQIQTQDDGSISRRLSSELEVTFS